MVMEEQVLEALRQVIDPELGVNIVDLGLIYNVSVQGGHVAVAMTMTSPACPLLDVLMEMAENAIWQLTDVHSVQVELVWEPPWHPDMMSPSAQRRLGWTS